MGSEQELIEKLMISKKIMDKHNNMGGMVSINKNSTKIVPKLIDVNKSDKKNYKISKINSPIRKQKIYGHIKFYQLIKFYIKLNN